MTKKNSTLRLCDILAELHIYYLNKGFKNMKIQIVDCINIKYIYSFPITILEEVPTHFFKYLLSQNVSLLDEAFGYDINQSNTLCTIFI